MAEPYRAEPLPPRDGSLDVSANHYWHYHRLEALLACKQPITASQDEDLFIAVHQICEVAFHQMIGDLERTLAALAIALDADEERPVGDTVEACYFLERVVRLYEVVNVTMPILVSMRAFGEFRSAIGPTSGFQSFQFRHLEILSGVAAPYWRGGTRDARGEVHPAEAEFDRRYGARVAGWLAEHQEHNLAHYYRRLLERAPGTEVQTSLTALFTHPGAASLLRLLARYEQQQTRFHRGHLALAVRQLAMVGASAGTGGTAFQAYLARYQREVEPLFAGLGPEDEGASAGVPGGGSIPGR
ncbi:tryptophan 2,3-dioxygenase family protein [Gloeobacter violaceus]|uniref:Glr2058 protein n=1 Tax=Gloeobacter violaceus (strain ATCC 29082 / PCC 7421) TaxID=251221 RepID=Q7NIX4_GLOVI|nr:tryptophan 2,3-dioxygenase family protein [Gloeobacter violaceus]BAC89999.1 glr2058 [Gloeobacter violaceus PCC 7421]